VRKVLVFQHVPFEPLGTLDETFRRAGLRIRYINFDRRPDGRARIERYNGLVVLGGPQAADQVERYPHLIYEREAIRRAIECDIPVLGICLGAQLIAATLGGRTLRGRAPEYGWVDVRPTAAGQADPLVGFMNRSEPIFQWHSDTFSLPPDVVHLAESDSCRYQAFRYRDNVYGFQFHLEANRALINRWLATPHRDKEFGSPGARLDPAQVRTQTDRNMPRARELGESVFGAFVERFFKARWRRVLTSR